MDQSIQIAVIGAADCSEGEARAAEEIGTILAKEGVVLISGGMSGVMEASCRGAATSGGVTVGILPGAGSGNPFVGVQIRTGMSHARNFIVVESADAVIAVGGGYGTLSEIAFALKTGKPIFGYMTWDIPGVIACSTPRDACIGALAAATR